jgi:hypothetical protein
VRDGCSLVALGKPVAVVVQATFERAARVHAKGLGCPDLPICSYPHPSPGTPAGAEIMDGLAQQIRERVIALISESKAPPQ